ncbi:MAG: GHKL domain-containing protein [Clostridia bacterium]|nr:GHKL domain-containing protein [Clostridia bacterium]
MQIDFLAINLLSAVLSALLISYFVKSFYKINLEFKNQVAFTILFGLLNGIVSVAIRDMGDLVNNLKPILLMSLSIIIIKLILDISILKSLISFFIVALGIGIGNAIVPLLFNLLGFSVTNITLENKIIIAALLNLFINVVAAIFIFTIKPIKGVFSSIKNSKTVIITLLLSFLLITTSASLQYFSNNFNPIIFTIITLLTTIYCVFTIWTSMVSYKTENQKIELEQQKFYNESLDNALHNLRRFKHDWVNNLGVIHDMLQEHEYIAAQSYINELLETDNKIGSTAILNIKNAGLHGIISSKIKLASDRGISLNLKSIGTIKDITNIKISELCEIIGIFLDNAIESTENENDKNIEVCILSDDSNIQITIKNPCFLQPEINKIFTPGYSTKGMGRGNGLFIVKKLLEKNQYVLNNTYYNENEKQFIQELAISLSKTTP